MDIGDASANKEKLLVLYLMIQLKVLYKKIQIYLRVIIRNI